MPATAFCSTTNRRCAARHLSRAKSPAAWRALKGLQECLYLGNLDSLRDWGHARDYVEMQWLMLQQDQPEDFVIATGQQHSVREFVSIAAEDLGMKLTWTGSGPDEKALDENGQVIVAVDPRYFRPAEVETLLGDATYARDRLGWKPRIGFEELVREMVQTDLEEAKRDALVRKHGFRSFERKE